MGISFVITPIVVYFIGFEKSEENSNGVVLVDQK
jgi:hypothetical protein